MLLLRWCYFVWGLVFVANMLGSPMQVTYHGKLLSSGVPLDGVYDIQISIWDSDEHGTRLGATNMVQGLVVRQGLVAVPVDLAGVILDGTPRWLEIAVRTNSTASAFSVLTPRQPLTIVPQAIFSLSSASAGMATNLLGGGSNLTHLPASRLLGQVPAASIPKITTNEIAAETDALYKRDNGQRGVITPFDCGAVGDGAADDTAALQNWINRAGTERLLALLPPAPGGFYKITDTLYASTAITMVGGSGGNHSTSEIQTRSKIKQFTGGKHGLVISTPSDSVHLSRTAFEADPASSATNAGYGVWFAGGPHNSDCSIMEQCLVTHFGVGVRAASQADSSFRQCSFGYNRVGIVIEGVANNVALDSCQLSYNIERQVHLLSGAKVLIQNCDIAAGADGTKSSQGVHSEPGQDLVMISSRFEDYTTNACLTVGEGTRLTLIGVKFGNYSGASRYSLVVTQSAVVTFNCDFGCLGPTGVPIYDLGAGRSSITALPPVRQYIGTGRMGYIGTATVFPVGRAMWTGSGPGPGGIGHNGWAIPGTLEWGWGVGPFQNDHGLYAYANMEEAGYSGLQAVDLLQFAKEKRAGFRGNGAFLTNLNGAAISPGTIGSTQIDPGTDAAYRAGETAITNGHSLPVTLSNNLSVLGDLRLGSSSLVINTNSAPSNGAPAAWFEVKSSDGSTWKVGLYK